MKVFLIILMILAVLFACYEIVLFIFDIRKKVIAKRLKKKVDNSAVNNAARKENKE